jgi:hypothetical protein
MRLTIISIVSLLTLPLLSADIGAQSNDPITALKQRCAAEIELYRERLASEARQKQRYEQALNSCRADLAEARKAAKAGVPKAPQFQAMDPAITAKPAWQAQLPTRPQPSTPSSPDGKRSSGPQLSGQPTYAAPGSGKADQVTSLDFPTVPGRNRDWLVAHIDQQYGLLAQLYTRDALRSLSEHESRFCRDSSTDLYCKMQVRLYWITQAL